MSDSNEQTETGDPAEALMRRGEYLRQLRMMELEDERQRAEEWKSVVDNKGPTDQVDVLPDSKTRVLRYDSYLLHQTYYDDLKHVDYKFLDFGSDTCSSRLIIEQDKSLGKGGLCWDAAYILAEYLVTNHTEWTGYGSDVSVCANMIELGTGTGLCGLMVAAAVPSAHVFLTDLPELQNLLQRNARRNFANVQSNFKQPNENHSFFSLSQRDEEALWQGRHGTLGNLTGTVTLGVLRWGDDKDMENYPPADVVFGADVVASLYDPVALAQTIYALCRDQNSMVFTSYKARLTGPHQLFNQELARLFEHVEHIIPNSRNKNPDVRIIRATGKRS